MIIFRNGSICNDNDDEDVDDDDDGIFGNPAKVTIQWCYALCTLDTMSIMYFTTLFLCSPEACTP